MSIDRSMRWVFVVLGAFTVGQMVNFKFYDVQGLWGSQNTLKHVELVELPTVAKAAIEASKACQTNASAVTEYDAKDCPPLPREAMRAAMGNVKIVPK